MKVHIADVVPGDQPSVAPDPYHVESMRWSAVELGPELPMPVFSSMEVWNPERIGAAAIYCSDGRWGEAFDEFCHRRLQIPRYDRLAIPGGPGCFAPADAAANKQCEAALDQLGFLVQAHKLERIVLITHYGCAHYGERLGRPAEQCLPVQLDDARAVAQTLRDWFPGITVEAYLAMRKGSVLTFHWLNG